MQLEDVSDEPHGARVRWAMKSFYGKDARTITVEELAHCKELASEEMLDEIHFMLREILKINKPS